MLSGQCGKRTACPLDGYPAVGFHVRERAEMLVHQFAGFGHASSEPSSNSFRTSQFMSEPLAGLSKQCL